jgi:hypothetical protein
LSRKILPLGRLEEKDRRERLGRNPHGSTSSVIGTERVLFPQAYGHAKNSLLLAHIARLFEKDSAERRSSWDRLKSEPGQPTDKRIRAFLVHLDWLRKRAASTNPLTGIPGVRNDVIGFRCCCGSVVFASKRRSSRSHRISF